MAGENEDLFDDSELEDEDEEETPAEEESDDEVPELDDEDENPAKSDESLLEMLSELGINLPPDVDLSDAEDFKSALYIAAHAVVMHMRNGDGDDAAAPEDEETSLLDDPNAAPVEEPAQGAMMSHNGTNGTHNRLPAIPPKPKKKAVQLSQDAVQMSQQLTETQQQLAQERLGNLDTFIGRLLKTGRVDAATAKSWRSVLSARQLSLAVGDDADVNYVLAQVQFAKSLPKNAVVKMSTLTAPSGGEPPAPDYVDRSGAEAKTTKKLIEHLTGAKQHKF